jgi:hypothetical protein
VPSNDLDVFLLEYFRRPNELRNVLLTSIESLPEFLRHGDDLEVRSGEGFYIGWRTRLEITHW